MPISTADLAKFQEYKTRQKTSSTGSVLSSVSILENSQKLPNTENQKSQNEEDLPDLISMCVKDIIEKLEKTEDFLELDNEQQNNFEINLRIEFIDNFVDKFEVILSKDIKMRIELLKIGKKIEDLQQITEIID